MWLDTETEKLKIKMHYTYFQFYQKVEKVVMDPFLFKCDLRRNLMATQNNISLRVTVMTLDLCFATIQIKFSINHCCKHALKTVKHAF